MAFNNYKLAILSLSEVRRPIEKIIYRKNTSRKSISTSRLRRRSKRNRFIGKNNTWKLSKRNSWKHGENRYTEN